MSNTQAEIGRNKTGIASSRGASERMIEGTNEFLPTTVGDEREIAEVRAFYAKDADRLGSVPPPANVTGMAKAAINSVRGTRPTQFIDKLGERLAFERTGVRLYEALISKYDAFGGFDGGPQRSELEEILLEEHEHFRMLTEIVTKLSGDPTVMTPSADLHATMTKGVLEVVVDPRTTFAQCLEAALVAELADNEGWDTLVDLARQNGEDDAAAMFSRALEEEVEHLENVRAWLAAAQNRPEE
jgi:rubrerythrin